MSSFGQINRVLSTWRPALARGPPRRSSSHARATSTVALALRCSAIGAREDPAWRRQSDPIAKRCVIASQRPGSKWLCPMRASSQSGTMRANCRNTP